MSSPSPAFRRATLAGGRQLSPRPLDPALVSAPSLGRIPAGISPLTQEAHGREAQQAALQANLVHQDNLWRELLEAELRGHKRWIENWSFLKDYDPMGNKKEHPKLPEYISLFSDTVPITVNQVIGSRVNTELELPSLLGASSYPCGHSSWTILLQGPPLPSIEKKRIQMEKRPQLGVDETAILGSGESVQLCSFCYS
ncbi:ciliary microtubule inner protein 5 isoform X1 [Notamacropus eugenii]|uniref:ciliary microtubule inner protein 5 isoform X1 n=1 Tax=Notamacropus eugenii TaxID=9315 RepID=UPI003B671941